VPAHLSDIYPNHPFYTKHDGLLPAKPDIGCISAWFCS